MLKNSNFKIQIPMHKYQSFKSLIWLHKIGIWAQEAELQVNVIVQRRKKYF
jgi:hypothetical protein